MTMSTTQIADLHPGDVVELTDDSWTPGTKVTGPLIERPNGALGLGIISHRESDKFTLNVRRSDGSPAYGYCRTLKVISHAIRPVYLNSDRTEHEVGDIVSYPGFNGPAIFVYAKDSAWAGGQEHGQQTHWRSVKYGMPDTGPIYYRDKLTLLFDARTGRAVSA